MHAIQLSICTHCLKGDDGQVCEGNNDYILRTHAQPLSLRSSFGKLNKTNNGIIKDKIIHINKFYDYNENTG